MTLVSTCLAAFAFAADIQINGFLYNITDSQEHTVTLTGYDEEFFFSATSPSNPTIGYWDEEEEGLVNVVIPWRVLINGVYYKVTSIGDRAFANCETMESITIPNSVTSIGRKAFEGCTYLTSVKVQWTTPLQVPSNIFDGVNVADATLLVPQGYSDAYSQADVWKDFGNISTYYEVDFNIIFKDPHVKALCVANWDNNEDGEISYREAQSVTSFGVVFKGDTEMTSFTELRSFSGLTSIADSTFAGCTALTEVTIAPNAKTIGKAAFAGCTSLVTVNFQSAQTSIGDYAFAGCTSLQEIAIPLKMTTIGEHAFEGCTALQTITFSTAVTTIKAYAFAGCTSLPKVTFPANLVTIGERAFDGCTSITSFTIPAKVTSIGYGAFANCTSNKTFTVNTSNKTYAHNSSKVYITDKTDKRMVVAFAVGAANKNISFAATVNEICPCAFEGDPLITSVNLTNIAKVGDNAFANCPALTQLWIPACVTSIGQKVFDNSNAITDVYCDSEEPYGINDNNFTDVVYSTAILHVPENVWQAYASLEGWRNFELITRPQFVSCDDVTIIPGKTASLVVNLAVDKGKEYSGYQFELILPEGVELVPEGDSYAYELSDRNPAGMMAAFESAGDGHYLVAAISLFNRAITGTDGPIITLQLKAAQNAELGTFPCEITNIVLIGKNSEDVNLLDTSFNLTVGFDFYPGDVNHDRQVNVTDVSLMVSYVMGTQMERFFFNEGDVNQDGSINISDISAVTNYVLTGVLPGSIPDPQPEPEAVAEFSNDAIRISFDFETNMSQLVQAGGNSRLLYPLDCVTVKANGVEKEIYSVEGFEDGRFYIFLNEGLAPSDVVEVTFTNPEGQEYHLVNLSETGGDVQDFTVTATYNSEVEGSDVCPYASITPQLVSADPENGAVEVPNNITEFKLKFDKDVDCSLLEATLNDEVLTVSPAEGYADEVTFVRTGTDALAGGDYTLHVTKIYPVRHLDESTFGDVTITFNVASPEPEPEAVAEFSNDVIQIGFDFETNMSQLVQAGDNSRLLFPLGCVTVKANGEDKEVYSVEGFEDGRFYIFLSEGLESGDVVEVTFANPEDEAYHLVNLSEAGGDVQDFTITATYNSEVEGSDVCPYASITPQLVSADPENGAVEVPNNITEFKLKFDKDVDCSLLEATLNDEVLTVSPAEGYADEVTFVRTGTDALAGGDYTLHVTKIYPVRHIDESTFSDVTITFNVASPEPEPEAVAEFSNDVIQIGFDFETNMSQLVQAGGNSRLLFPLDCVTVKANGEDKEVYSVEGFEDGRFYIFLSEGLESGDVVEVTFANPEDEAYHLVNLSEAGGDVQDFTITATYNSEVEGSDVCPYASITPQLVSADPENGAVEVPNNITEFKLTFDKDVDCSLLEATLNDEVLTVSPAEGYADEVTFVRTGTDALAGGDYTLHVTKIYPVRHLDESTFGDVTITFNVASPEPEPEAVVEFSSDVIQIGFDFETNMGQLVQASGNSRLLFPLGCVTVKANGEDKEVYSVEGFEDGRFYIFLSEGLESGDVVEVTFANPEDEAYHLVNLSEAGGDVQDFTITATYNSEVEGSDVCPYASITPQLVSADPENGAVEVPNNITEFKLKFDKDVDCSLLEATLNDEVLTVSPAEGYADEVTFVRTSTDDLADGDYTLHVTKIYPVRHLDESTFGDVTITFTVGIPATPPDDEPAPMYTPVPKPIRK